MQDVRKFHDKFYEISKTENDIKKQNITLHFTLHFRIHFNQTLPEAEAKNCHGARKSLTTKYYVPWVCQKNISLSTKHNKITSAETPTKTWDPLRKKRGVLTEKPFCLLVKDKC